MEYSFEDTFSVRTGYFNESQEKGSRRYLTMGAGFDIKSLDIDISYLFSTSNVRNPLENTIRLFCYFLHKNLLNIPNIECQNYSIKFYE